MGRFDFCDAKMLRGGCFKKYIQAPLIGMRIWFGVILKIMVRMKSKPNDNKKIQVKILCEGWLYFGMRSVNFI